LCRNAQRECLLIIWIGKAPVPGDLVYASPESHAGGYAPCIDTPHWKNWYCSLRGQVPTIKVMEGDWTVNCIEMNAGSCELLHQFDRLVVHWSRRLSLRFL